MSFLKTCVRRSMNSRIILVLVCTVKRCRGTVGSPERETVFYLQNVDARRPMRHMRQKGARGCLRRNISETVNSQWGASLQVGISVRQSTHWGKRLLVKRYIDKGHLFYCRKCFTITLSTLYPFLEQHKRKVGN